MTVLKPLAALLLVAGLAACSTDVDETDASAGVGPSYGAGQFDPASVEYFNQSIGDRVFFATDSSLLDAASQATLRAQADWLRQNAARTATIEGHADERGTREYNLALGARRAAAARSFLIGEGIDASRLRMVTYGKERPEALCSNDSCWSQNRRSVTVIAGGPIS